MWKKKLMTNLVESELPKDIENKEDIKEVGKTKIITVDALKPNFKEWLIFFEKNGYIIINNAVNDEILVRLRKDLEEQNKKNGAKIKDKTNNTRHVMNKCFFEHSSTTVDLISDSVLSNFAQYVIRGGPEPDNDKMDSLQVHLIHNNAFSVPPSGRGQAPSWHMDDPLQQVIIPDGKVLPEWIKLPCLVATYMIWLSDCENVENGPTHIVPGSHRFGKTIDRDYAEQNAIPACGKAGTAVLVNSQTWHRGCANTSKIARDTLQLTFGRRIIGHKHKTIMNYLMPNHVYKDKDERTLKRLGFLQGGAYS